jgi:hypothetical protein
MSDLSEGHDADEASSGSVTEDESEESGPDFQLSPPEGFGGPGTASSESSSSDDSMEADDAGSDSEDESGDDETEEDGSVSI